MLTWRPLPWREICQVANAYTEPEEGPATSDEQARRDGEQEPPA